MYMLHMYLFQFISIFFDHTKLILSTHEDYRIWLVRIVMQLETIEEIALYTEEHMRGCDKSDREEKLVARRERGETSSSDQALCATQLR